MARVPIALHPGKILLTEMDEAGLTQAKLADALRIPTAHLAQVIRGERDITAEFAARLARFFGGSPEAWLLLQNRHSLACVHHEAIEREVVPIVRAAKAAARGV